MESIKNQDTESPLHCRGILDRIDTKPSLARVFIKYFISIRCYSPGCQLAISSEGALKAVSPMLPIDTFELTFKSLTVFSDLDPTDKLKEGREVVQTHLHKRSLYGIERLPESRHSKDPRLFLLAYFFSATERRSSARNIAPVSILLGHQKGFKCTKFVSRTRNLSLKELQSWYRFNGNINTIYPSNKKSSR
jgi:hypothetical protein